MRRGTRLAKRSLNYNLFKSVTQLGPFTGSGSECVAAKWENIHFIGFEINEAYVNWVLKVGKLAAKLGGVDAFFYFR